MRSTNSLTGKESDALYHLTLASDIVQLMQAIQREQKLIMLALPGGQNILTVLLDVNERVAGHFHYDSGRNRGETRAVLSSGNIQFSAALRGVSVRFSTPTPVETIFDEAAAFLSPLPLDIKYFQRRENYRTTCIRPYGCTGRLTNGTAISLNLGDLSIGGVGLQSNTISPEILPIGTLLLEAVLDFQDLGKVEVTLLVTSHHKLVHAGFTTYCYSCRFEQLSRSKEATVQRLIFLQEQLNRANTRRDVYRG